MDCISACFGRSINSPNVTPTAVEKDELWCSPGGVHLYQSHKDRLLCKIKNGWVDDNIVTAATMMVKQESPKFNGLHRTDSFYGQCRAPAKKRLEYITRMRFKIFDDHYEIPTGRQVQILYTGSAHWVLVSNFHEYERELVYVYDSDDSIVTDMLIAKIAAVFRFSANKFRIVWPYVDRQQNNRDCGIYAIAFLVALAHGSDPADLKFESSMKLRHYLIRCFARGHFGLSDAFPVRPDATESGISLSGKLFSRFSQCSIQARRRFLFRERVIPVICRCRMTKGRGNLDKTLICRNYENCHSPLFHRSCILLFDRAYFGLVKTSDWMCPACRDFLVGC